MTARAANSVLTQSGRIPGEDPIVCAQCATPFERRPRGRNAKFCSTRCRSRFHAAQKAALLDELATTLARATALVRELRDASARLTG